MERFQTRDQALSISRVLASLFHRRGFSYLSLPLLSPSLQGDYNHDVDDTFKLIDTAGAKLTLGNNGREQFKGTKLTLSCIILVNNFVSKNNVSLCL